MVFISNRVDSLDTAQSTLEDPAMGDNIKRDILMLKAYSVLVTMLLGTVLVCGFARADGQANQKPKFAEIDVERINIVEKDGTIKMVISNKERTPDPVVGGKTLRGKRQGDKSPGIIFYNDQGDEDGGLAFGGQEKDGKSSAHAALLFDQFNQDQTVGIMYSESNGRRSAGLRVWDRPDTPLLKSVDKFESIAKMQDGPEKTEAIRKLRETGELGANRLFVGKTDDKSAAVILSDGMGRPRIRMTVDTAGAGKLEFLDEHGKTTYSFPEAATPAVKR
jgi:hypothetical protein